MINLNIETEEGKYIENESNMINMLFKEAMSQNNQNAELLELELNIISPESMLELNANTRGVNYATDVLSFPALENCLTTEINAKNYPFDVDYESGLIYFGEIDINIEKVKEQAKEYNHSQAREFYYLFVHACMHLLGYDHENEEEKKIMREQEEKVLEKFNITRG